jgi:GTPase
LTPSDADPPAEPRRAGYVTLVGRPNAGKSTLLNRLVGEHLSIVTPKPQTTWQRVTGIRTEGSSQMIFLDTPGLLEPRDLFGRAMVGAALEALAEADVTLLVVDGTEAPSSADQDKISSALADLRSPLHVAINKVDSAAPRETDAWQEWAQKHLDGRVQRVSAARGDGCDELIEALRRDLPEGPFLYPEDDIASDPVRFFVAELVRETIFERYHQEIPYSVFCVVEELRDDQDPVYIHVDICVERKSQTGILVGKGGAAIRELGKASRTKIEHFLQRPVYLDLWVKPLESWRKSRSHLSRLGFRLPADHESAS